MEEKTFNAVKMIREIRDRTAEELHGLSREERMAYYRKKAKGQYIGSWIESATVEDGRRLHNPFTPGSPFAVRKIVEDVKRPEADRKKMQQRERRGSIA